MEKNIRIYSDLNPENCSSKGYEWISDTIYDPEAPDEVNSDLMDHVQKGYLLGEPANKNTIQNGGVGVYKPLNSHG